MSGQEVMGGRVAPLSEPLGYEYETWKSEALELDGNLLTLCRSKRDERNFEYRAGVCRPSNATSRELRTSISRGTIKSISRCCFSSRSGRSVGRNNWRGVCQQRFLFLKKKKGMERVTHIRQKGCSIGHVKEICFHSIT